MLGRQHVQFALVASAASYFALHTQIADFGDPVLFIGTAAVGSLIPDLDSPTSTLGRLVPPVSHIIAKLFGHRGLTHDVIFIGILTVLSLYFYPMMFGFWFGYWSHLLLDSLTVRGICWGYFFHRRKVEFHREDAGFIHGRIHLLPEKLRVSSNGFMATVVTYALSAIVIYGCYQAGIIL